AVAAWTALLAAPVAAQPPRFDDLHRMFPWNFASLNRTLRIGDVDGDGDPDIWACESEPNGTSIHRLLLNDGAARLTSAPALLPALAEAASDLALGDVDGDGDLDAFVANGAPWLVGTQDRLLLNAGSGTYYDATSQLPPILGQTDSVALGDVDGDGDLDALLGVGAPFSTVSSGGLDRIYLNDGSGSFAYDATRLPADSDATSAVGLGDLDGDGDLDAVFGVYGGVNPQRLYTNDGTGHFFNASSQFPAGAYCASAVALGDADGDGDLDLFLGAFGPCTTSGLITCQSGPARLFLNDGSSVFSEAPLPPPPGSVEWTTSIALGDLDGDGDLDALLGNNGPCVWVIGSCPAGQNRLLLNAGSGSFLVAQGQFPSIPAWTRSLALADLDADGDLDLVVGDDAAHPARPTRLYLNSGSGYFLEVSGSSPETPLPQHPVAAALGDLDGDGDLDLFVGGRAADGPGPSRVFLNDGRGDFALAGAQPFGQVIATSVALGDVEGDGDLDVLVGTTGSTSDSPNGDYPRLFLNDGAGVLSLANGQLPLAPLQTSVVVTGDLDGDGDLDAVLGMYNHPGGPLSPVRSYANDGAGTFTYDPARFPPHLDLVSSIALGDVDGDGDLDVLVGTGPSETTLYGGP
ncbi:MAG TPA: VCBS repeat-containing protein, partial [Planctomycetota bacterium]|nr:VCBS repeat-containing protein [Planctomycetota bacterium]